MLVVRHNIRNWEINGKKIIIMVKKKKVKKVTLNHKERRMKDEEDKRVAIGVQPEVRSDSVYRFATDASKDLSFLFLPTSSACLLPLLPSTIYHLPFTFCLNFFSYTIHSSIRLTLLAKR